MRVTTYLGYSIERLYFSQDLKDFIAEKRGRTKELNYAIHDAVEKAGYRRALSTVASDLTNGVVPRGLSEIYLDIFQKQGFNSDTKSFFTKAEVIEKSVKEVEVKEVVVEKEVTAKGQDWDHVALFKLVSQLTDSELLYLTLLVGSNDIHFYKQQADYLLKRGLITEADIRPEENKYGTERQKNKRTR